MALPAVFAILSWAIYNWAGIQAKGFGRYLKDIAFPPGVSPKAIYILVTPIEVIAALFLRPLTLAIRLFANFFAGHLLLVVAFVGTAYLLGNPVTAAFAAVSIVGGIVGIGLEIFIAAVQAYVFALLTAAYIRLSTVEEH
jgi:F-type H+-transporting ATPase subunit a